MNMSNKAISKYGTGLLAVLLFTLCTLLRCRSVDAVPGAYPLAAAEREQELDENQALPLAQAREPLAATSSASGWIELADENSLAPLQAGGLWMQELDEEYAEPFEVETRQPLTPSRMIPCQIFARVPGYVPFSGRLTPRSGANVLLLERAGSLEVKMVSLGGNPVEGCEVGLFLDRERDDGAGKEISRTSAKPVRELIYTPRGWMQARRGLGRSDWPKTLGPEDWDAPIRPTSADGLATWTDIPAASGYRWFVVSTFHAEVEPPHEQKRLEDLGDRVRTSAPPPPGLSGRFDITAGETLRLTGTLLAGATVRGRVECPAAKRAAVVTLYSVDRAAENTGHQVVSFDETEDQPCDPDGAFEFTNLRPGVWAVRAWWEEEERDYFFTCATFLLEAGANLDLGLLHPLAGDSLEVAIGIADQYGIPQAPEVVYSPRIDSLGANLSITVMPDSGIATQMVSGYFFVPFGEIFRIHGLVPGRVFVGADPSPHLTVDPTRVGSLGGVRPEGLEVGSMDFVYLELRATMGKARPLVLRNEQGQQILPPAIWVRELGTERVFSATAQRLEPTAAGRQQALNLPDGSYEFLCKFTSPGAPQGFSARARATFDGSDRGPIEFDARPAVSVSGVLRDSSGAALPNQELVWGLEDWSLDPENPVFAATTDSQGAFVLAEIPASTALRSSRAGCDLPPFAPGRHEGLVLTTTQ